MEVYVCPASELAEGQVKIVSDGKREIGVLRDNGRTYAFLNHCPHQGGPVCEGVRMPKVEAVIDDQKRFFGHKFSDTERHLVCPWHGYEYDLETGACAGDPGLRLRRFDLVERDAGLYVVL